MHDQSGLTGEDIICFSSIDWDFNWQGHQEIMLRLAQQGNRVLFVDNTGLRPPITFADINRMKGRILNWVKGITGIRQEHENLYVYSPVILPFPYSILAYWINKLIMHRAIKRWMDAVKFGRPIVWTFLPTPLVLGLIRSLDPKLTIYYCIADFAYLSTRPKKIVRSEKSLLKQADVIFSQGEVLRKHCGSGKNVHVFPFGVKTETFNPNCEIAPELAPLKTPIVGYVGGIHKHVDTDLLETIARSGDWSLVFVGPLQVSSKRLPQLENVVFLGQRPHAEVPRFIQGFDVCIIPYHLSEYTETVFPTKLNEYLIMGKPVVSTALPEVEAFNRRHSGIVRVAHDPKAFVEAIRHGLKEDGTSDHRSRQQVASQYSWEFITAKMTNIIRLALEEKRLSLDRGWQMDLLKTLRRLKIKAATAALVLALAYWVTFHSPALWLMARPLKKVDVARSVDAIVVLGGGVGESGKAGQGYEERVQYAVDLYKSQIAKNIIFSSGYIYAIQEAKIMEALAVSIGVPARSIILETKAANTYQNVKFVSEILTEKGWHSLAVISSPYHMRRLSLVFRKNAPNIKVIYTPIPSSGFYGNEGVIEVRHIQAILHEYLAIVYYWWKGQI